MKFQNDRIYIRNFCQEDLVDFNEYGSDFDVSINAGFKIHESMDESQMILSKFINEKNLYAIVYKENNKVIGSFDFEKDFYRSTPDVYCIGYVLNKNYWNKGIMTEVVQGILRHLFLDLNAKLVTVNHYKNNDRSRRVIEKNGFKLEGTLRMQKVLFDGAIVDTCFYSLTQQEYLAFIESKTK